LITYVDTSFLVSLYSLDVNSPAAARVMQTGGGDRFLTTFGEIELANAIELRVFRKDASAAQARSSWKDFEQDLGNGIFQIRPLTDQVFERARQLVRATTARLGTRTADLLHVAAALELKADRLFSFDQQQRKLAHEVRLKLN
jgi:predicted nucleic acid-binding protein